MNLPRRFYTGRIRISRWRHWLTNNLGLPGLGPAALLSAFSSTFSVARQKRRGRDLVMYSFAPNFQRFSRFVWTTSVSWFVDHGRKSREGQRTSPPEFVVGDGNANCPQILSRFKISCTWLLQCSKKLTNLMILTKYSLLPESTSSTSTKSPLQAKNSTFFWWWHGQNIPLNSECTKTRHSSKKIII